VEKHKNTRQTIVRLLSSMGSAKEIQQYLKRFSQLDAKRFAVVKVASLRAGSIPVISSLGETEEGQILNINADFAANELVRMLQPYKIVFLTGTGGLLDGKGKVIDSINLSTEYEHLMAQPWLNGGMRVKIEQIADLLADLPLTSSVSITRPAELAKELFTHKGSGTLVRRGEKVFALTSWDGIEQSRMRELIESSFGRTLVADYFERTQPYRIYVSENYRAAMILVEAEGLVYLDKFAVLDDADAFPVSVHA
jgi:acetylglutamate synthase